MFAVSALGNEAGFYELRFCHQGSRILATGKPVVISPLPEYEPMADVLRIARSRDQFLSLVEDALNESGPGGCRLRRQAAVANGTLGRSRRMGEAN